MKSKQRLKQSAHPPASTSTLSPSAAPPEVIAELDLAERHAVALASALQQAFWKAEDHGAAAAASRIERLEMATAELREDLQKLKGARS